MNRSLPLLLLAALFALAAAGVRAEPAAATEPAAAAAEPAVDFDALVKSHIAEVASQIDTVRGQVVDAEAKAAAFATDAVRSAVASVEAGVEAAKAAAAEAKAAAEAAAAKIADSASSGASAAGDAVKAAAGAAARVEALEKATAEIRATSESIAASVAEAAAARAELAARIEANHAELKQAISEAGASADPKAWLLARSQEARAFYGQKVAPFVARAKDQTLAATGKAQAWAQANLPVVQKAADKALAQARVLSKEFVVRGRALMAKLEAVLTAKLTEAGVAVDQVVLIVRVVTALVGLTVAVVAFFLVRWFLANILLCGLCRSSKPKRKVKTN